MCNNCSRICYPSEFFPDVKGNLTKIVWAHAVNSQAELEKALSAGRSIGNRQSTTRASLRLFFRLLHSRVWADVALVILACSNMPPALPENVGIALKIFYVALVDVPRISEVDGEQVFFFFIRDKMLTGIIN